MSSKVSSASWKAQSALSSISLSEVISALSFALDLTEGAVPGHALRSCLLGMRIAEEIGLPMEQRQSLYYALLLKDTGCSSSAARMCEIAGENSWGGQHATQRGSRRLLFSDMLPARGSWRQSRMLRSSLSQLEANAEVSAMRCQRAASILSKLGMGILASQAVLHLDEHWDGGGYPGGIKGERIPLLARIGAIAQHLDLFSSERGVAEAIATLQERSGTWFDPELVRLTLSLHREGLLWRYCLAGDSIETTRQAVLDIEGTDQLVAPSRIDQVCEAFADVVDAKSPFTFSHSVGVANIAYDIARTMGLSAERVQVVRRTALLHDIGKLGISNTILDKPGILTMRERIIVEEHPTLTRRILERVGAFGEVAVIAGEHHEKLDGTGYPNRLVAKDLSLESRIVAVSDVFGAMHEDRPYRKGVGIDEIVPIMQAEAPRKLDQDCLEALFTVLEKHHEPLWVEAPLMLPPAKGLLATHHAFARLA
jgi:putative nucleotidyltransferase with HDIG domain